MINCFFPNFNNTWTKTTKTETELKTFDSAPDMYDYLILGSKTQ